MYAIVNINGVQQKATPEEILELPRLKAEPGAKVKFTEVMLVGDGDKITVGKPYLDGAQVTLEVIEHFRGPKLRIFKFKRRRDYRRRQGHRDECTRVRVAAIKV